VGKLQTYLVLGPCQATAKHEQTEEEGESDEEISNLVRNFSIPGKQRPAHAST
jgi:hypothetical protein